MALLEHGRIRRIAVDELVEPGSLQNLNTPADYRRLRALARA